jgi:hypothetical protein
MPGLFSRSLAGIRFSDAGSEQEDCDEYSKRSDLRPRAYTVRRQGNKFYIPLTCAFDGKPQWGKPYASLQAACAAIARRYADEWRRRDQRRNAFYRKKEATR